MTFSLTGWIWGVLTIILPCSLALQQSPGHWKIRNKMAIEKIFPKHPCDAMYKYISCLQQWRILLKERDRDKIDNVLNSAIKWLRYFRSRGEGWPVSELLSLGSEWLSCLMRFLVQYWCFVLCSLVFICKMESPAFVRLTLWINSVTSFQ